MLKSAIRLADIVFQPAFEAIEVGGMALRIVQV